MLRMRAKMKSKCTFIPFVLGLGLALALLLTLGGQDTPAALALSTNEGPDVESPSDAAQGHFEALAIPAAELHVCLAGPPTCDYASIQAAVDAA
ncbi:MAG: hypothetical protein DRO87_12370, partial [Candidatus Thorarchaeota archaeon]